MKHLKAYETLRSLNLSHKSIWIIYGNMEEQYSVITVLKNKILNDSLEKDLEMILYELPKDENFKNSIGMILSYTDNGCFQYYPFDTTEEKKDVMNDYYENFKLKGELRIENNNIIIDTIEFERDKYNL